MLIPLAVYLARWERRARWWIAAALLSLGALATLSRTSILMLIVVALVLLRLRPVETRRLWPVVLPMLIAAHIALPGAIGTIKESFFPKGGLIAEQQQLAGERSSGRIADLGPGLSEASHQPILGQGYGTRVVDVGRANALILDNQWLGSLLETGFVGIIALLWLFGRAVRRLSAAAKDDTSDGGWLYAALAASVLAFAVGMFTYDAFSFIQVTVMLFMLLALSACAIAQREPEAVRLGLVRP
jgi:O-antigen ligase